MRAELAFFGQTLDMAPRRRRRGLVICIFAALALALTGGWFADQWHSTGAYMIFAAIAANRVFLGGYAFGGLIKPFNGKRPPQSSPMQSQLSLVLRVYRPDPEANHYRNDERELEQRNAAVYKAYQAIILALTLLWLMANFHVHLPATIARLGIPMDSLLYGVATAAVVLAFTLPQAILLWTEPDMEEEPG